MKRSSPKPINARPSRRAFSCPLLLGAFVALLLILGATLLPPPASASTAATLSGILKKSHLPSDTTSVLAWDFDTGRVIFAKNASTPLIPASTMKLVTTATSFIYWKPNHRFRTELWVPVTPARNGVLHGNVYLKGYGDPSLSRTRYQRTELGFKTASFEQAIGYFKNHGIRRIEGSIIGDETWFDRSRSCSTWKKRLYPQCASLGALVGNGSFAVSTSKGREPARSTAALFTSALKSAEIKVTGKPAVGTLPPSGSRLALRLSSAPLATVVRHMNKESDNFFAEMLTKGLGKDFYDVGSTEAGVQLSRLFLASLDASPASFTVLDGSGLSYTNRLTAEDLVKLLGAMRQRPEYFTAFHRSLAVAGKDGTLKKRMRGTSAAGTVYAKTGTLADASCLVGYTESANGHEIGFAILVNDKDVDALRAHKLQDQLAIALTKSWLPGSPLSCVLPQARQRSVSAAAPAFTGGRCLQPTVDP